MQSSLGRLQQLVQSPQAQELDELRTQLRQLEHRLSVLLEDLDEEALDGVGDADDMPAEQSVSPEAASSS